MAYNPFNIFRRNQKVIFAVLTVFIMIMFTLSSGVVGGDFFDWLPRWLGQKSARKGDVVCKLDGSKVYAGELEQVRFQRVMANRYMSMAADQALRALDRYTTDNFHTLSPEVRSVVAQVNQLERNLQFFAQNPMFFYEALGRMRAMLMPVLEAPTTRADDKTVLRAKLATLLLLESGAGGEHYFVNAPNRTQRDMVNYLLWQKKADQLGIQFTTDDVKRLIRSEFYDAYTSNVEIRRYLENSMPGFNMDRCLEAIGEEFRVRTAQVAVFGPGFLTPARGDKTFGGTPVYGPAYEVFDFYREQTSPTIYQVVAVLGANFIDQVAAEPTEADLKKLYDMYQNQEYDPGLERPGFKFPRTIKLEWVSATGTEPYYLQKAEEKIKNEELQRALGALGAIQTIGGSAVAVPVLARPFVIDPLADEYASRIEAEHNRRIRDWGGFFDREMLDTSVVRPTTMAAVAGGLAGGQLTLGGPLPGLALLDSAAAAMERRDRIKAGLPLLLGAVPGPSLLATAVAGEAAYRTMLPKPLPLEAVRAELIKKAAERTARELVFGRPQQLGEPTLTDAQRQARRGDLQAFIDMADALPSPGGFFSRRALDVYVAGAVAERGWQHGSSTALRDEWTLEDDPGLTPLKEVFTRSPHGNMPVRFGKKFFWADTFPGEPKSPVTGTYRPEFYPNAPTGFESPFARPDPKFVVWRTEETPARRPQEPRRGSGYGQGGVEAGPGPQAGQGPGGEPGQRHPGQRRG
jgi:hypothetical protein